MQEIYKGYEINASREGSLGGDENLYFSVYRAEDGLEVVADFTTGSDTEEEYIGYMKQRVDQFIESKGESEDMAEDYAI